MEMFLGLKNTNKRSFLKDMSAWYDTWENMMGGRDGAVLDSAPEGSSDVLEDSAHEVTSVVLEDSPQRFKIKILLEMDQKGMMPQGIVWTHYQQNLVEALMSIQG